MEGLYVHIPFCGKKCPYCDFFSVIGRPVPFEDYFEALLKEVRLYSEKYPLRFKTIYFGGGTPSSVPPKVYARFLKKLSKIADLSEVEEITMEVNPESYSLEDFKLLREVGFNRISVGVQSFLEKNLRLLGRTHSVRHSLRTLENLSKAGFENISVDLIWGIPGQTEKDLKEEFKVLENLPAVHLSAYLLTLYEGTPFYRLFEEGKLKLPSEERVERLYHLLLEETKRLGFERYEISNFAKEERFRSKHNLLYWKSRPWLGVGASAWSFDGKRRWSNLKNLRLYVELLKEGKPPTADVMDLSEEELLKEKLIMGLRTTEGVPKEWIENKLDPQLVEEFFVPAKGGKNLAFNDRGFLVSNSLLAMLI